MNNCVEKHARWFRKSMPVAGEIVCTGTTRGALEWFPLGNCLALRPLPQKEPRGWPAKDAWAHRP